MMLDIPPEEWKSLSHRKRRQLINKEKRRRKRTAEAQEREREQSALEQDPEYLEQLCIEEKRLAEEERYRALQEEQWRERERVAQEAFRMKREAEEKTIREREERERLIREEWEALQKKERQEEEEQEQAKREKESFGQERLQEALRAGETPLHETSWASPRWAPKSSTPPLSPPSQSTPSQASQDPNYGTEQDPKHCSFYLKTGACRFKERCSRLHPRPHSSTTLMLPGMYTSLGFMEQTVDDRDQDTELEYDEGELYEQFCVFYKDTLPEFKKAGKVVQFKVSCNYEPHLRGNVYVQYSTEEECNRAYQMFNGRWYAGRQLSCEYCPVQKWRSAICGLFNMKRCIKGRHCNFLHVFKNPDREFHRANRDLPPLSPHSHKGHSYTPPHHHRRYSSYYRRSRSPRSQSRNRHRRSSTDSNSPSPERRHTRHSRSHHSQRRSRSQSGETHGSRRHRHHFSRKNCLSAKRRSKSVSSSSDGSQGHRSKSGSNTDSDSAQKHSKHRDKSKKRKRRSKASVSPTGSVDVSTKRIYHKKKHKHRHRHRHGKHSRSTMESKEELSGAPKSWDVGESNSEPPSTISVASAQDNLGCENEHEA